MYKTEHLTICLIAILFFSGCESDDSKMTDDIIIEQKTFVPDDFFEQYLIDQGYDNQLDGQVTTAVVETILEIDLTNIPVADLTGLEDFTSLQKFKIRSFELTAFDPSPNTNLKYLSTNGCINLIDLNVSNLVHLDTLYMSNNNSIKQLDVSNNINIQSLHLIMASLETLTLPQGQTDILTDLIINSSQLQELDLTPYENLYSVELKGNRFTDLDVSENPLLVHVDCPDNPLTSLNLANGMNQSLLFLDARTLNGSLDCIQIDAGFSPPTDGSWNKDEQSTYSEECL